MDPELVAELAAWENDHWTRSSGPPASSGTSIPRIGAYSPLDGATVETEVTTDRTMIDFLDATPIGSVLAVRFRWPLDTMQRDLFLMVDYRNYPHTVTGASTWLLEYVAQNLEHDPSWFPHEIVPLSATSAIVQLRRQPPGGDDSAQPS